jgi:hypothetical protein
VNVPWDTVLEQYEQKGYNANVNWWSVYNSNTGKGMDIHGARPVIENNGFVEPGGRLDFMPQFTPEPPLTITETMLPDGSVGVSYNYQLRGANGVAPYTWSARGLPAGLAMGTDGMISGIPVSAGRFVVYVTLSDSRNATVSKSFGMEIFSKKTCVYVRTVTATCWTGGWDVNMCQDCGEIEVDINGNPVTYGWRGSFGHVYLVVNNTTPSCWAGGGDFVECLRCGHRALINWNGALGHDFGRPNAIPGNNIWNIVHCERAGCGHSKFVAKGA